jgi:tetratricopeptide (TPR) repeat protein
MPPVASEIGQMIRLPTRAAGLRFEEDFASSERLDDILRDAAAEHPEILPLLQFTLEELYQRRTPNGTLTLAAYRELGGVEGSLAQRAETVFQELPPAVQAALPKVLNALVSIGQDGHETIGRKRAPWKDATDPNVRILLETFVAARLFVTELSDDGGAVVTVAHEALLWYWPRVTEWVDQNRENLRIRGRIAGAAERWVQEQKPADLLLPRGKPLGEAETLLEQDIDLSEVEGAYIDASIARAKRAHRLRNTVVAMLAMMAILAGSAAFLAGEQRNRAIEAQSRAEVEAETARRTTEFMVGLFEVSDPSEALGNSITAREIMDRGADRIEAELAEQPQIQATLMETMGTVYTSLALYPQAESLLKRALDLRHALFGDRHLEVARTWDRLGQVLTRQADYADAEEALSTALAIRQELHGKEHLEVAESLTNMAELQGRKGEFEEAEPLLRQALEMRTSLLGKEHMEVAQSIERLGLNMFDQGDYASAESMLRESIDMRKKLLGGNPHPQLAEGLNNLGLVLMETGNIRAAQLMYQEALEMNQSMLDEFHPTIAVNMNNLALLYHDSGEFDSAESMYRHVIEIRERSLGEEHPEVALAMSNLAYLLYDKGSSEAAMSLQRQAIDKYRNVFPLGHPDLASSLGALGSWLTNAGRYTDAEPMLQESLEMRMGIFGEEHVQVAVGKTALAQLYLATGRIEEAETAARAAYRVLTVQLPEGHWRTAWAASIEGSTLAHRKQFQEGEKMLLDSLATLRQEPGSGSRTVYVENTLAYLADLYRNWGKSDKAAVYLAMMNDGVRR